MTIAKVRLNFNEIDTTTLPVYIPSVEEVRNFAFDLHRKGESWEGEAFGWFAEYSPEQLTPPLDSKMTFAPANFCIGESGIWFYSLMWERGKNQNPVEFLDDRFEVNCT